MWEFRKLDELVMSKLEAGYLGAVPETTYSPALL